MDKVFDMMMVIEAMLRSGFVLVLAISSYQDWRVHKIHIHVFILFGMAGTALRGMQLIMELKILCKSANPAGLWIYTAGRLGDIAAAMALGAGLLALSAITNRAIGRGDGWFFVVSGLYLGLTRNMLLLCGGLFFYFMVCCMLWIKEAGRGQRVRGMRLPFLPFLIPAGLAVMLL